MSDSDYEEADEITPADVDRLRQQLSDKVSAVDDYLLSSREPVDKRRLISNTMQDLLVAFNHMATTYLRYTAAGQMTSHCKSAISRTIRKEVAVAIQEALPLLQAPMSYAGAASKSIAKDAVKLKVTNGPTVVVPSTTSVVIGPKSGSAATFTSADATRNAVFKAVKPVEVGLRVNRIVNTRNNAVRIIADSLDVAKLKKCKELDAAGLEVKEQERLNPRLVVRDVPTDLTNDDLVAEIISLNLDDDCRDQVKVVYRYPSRRNNGSASVVVETSAEVRRRFLRSGRICLSWRSCKVEDHLRILQCYKCQSFGHVAKSCASPAVCGNCAGPHETSSCAGKTVALKCNNCVLGKMTSVDHKAFDATRCPIIKRRLTEKAKNIAY